MTPAAKSLETILTRCGIALDVDQIQLLWRYHQMLAHG